MSIVSRVIIIKHYYNIHLTHLKKSHLACGSSALPSPLLHTQNSFPVFGPFLRTFLLKDSSLCFVQSGAGAGGLKRSPQADLAAMLEGLFCEAGKLSQHS